MSWERDPLTDGVCWKECASSGDVTNCTVLTVTEALEDAAPSLRAMQRAREVEDVLRRFGIGK